MMPPTCVVFQSSLEAILLLLASKISRVGLDIASVIPKGTSDGPIARIRIFFVEPAGPWAIKPSISTFSFVPTGSRVETLATRPAGVAAGVPVGVAVAVAVGCGVGVGVAAGVGVGVEVGLGVGACSVVKICWTPCVVPASFVAVALK